MFFCRCVAIVAWLFIALLPLKSQTSSLNVVLLGDSNTWLGGDDCSKPKGWNSWFVRELQPASCRSYARSGATWTNTPKTQRDTEENIGVLGDNNVIYNQICRLSEAVAKGEQPLPNLIIILAGTNDAWFCDQRPQAFSEPARPSKSCCSDISPNTVLTLQESVAYGCCLLYESYPDALLVLATPPQTIAVETVLINRTGDIVEQVGDSLSIPVIRLDHSSCIERESELQRKYYTYDGTHTSEAGAQCIGRLVASRIIDIVRDTKATLF